MDQNSENIVLISNSCRNCVADLNFNVIFEVLGLYKMHLLFFQIMVSLVFRESTEDSGYLLGVQYKCSNT